VDALQEAQVGEIVTIQRGEVMLAAVITQTERIGSPLLGIVIPLAIFVVSFIVTWLLYKHFSKRSH
jgi:hypothetical protein